MKNKKHYWLYVLKLEHGKYYVGITSKTPEIRFRQHVKGTMGAAWTRKHKPQRILDRKDLGFTTFAKAESYENKVVRKYIKKYDIDNVRGGDISLSKDLIVRFGSWWPREDWEVLTTVTFLLLCIALILVSYILKK